MGAMVVVVHGVGVNIDRIKAVAIIAVAIAVVINAIAVTVRGIAPHMGPQVLMRGINP
jgi:uncharacterized membrane-anchored protein